MSIRLQRVLKGIIFAIIAVVILVICNFIAQPIWTNQVYNPPYSFYEEPADTIETIFLGSSHVSLGVSPTELYDKYGICACDLSTDAQPVTASYFWMKEAYRYHETTLDTVVLDVSMLMKDTTISHYHEAIDPLHFSWNKI